MRNTSAWGVITLVIIVIIGLLVWYAWAGSDGVPGNATTTSATSTVETAAVQDIVEEFGTHLKNVSLSASADQVADAIESEYARFVSADLLNTWAEDPSSAPGRETSSPWPERIDVDRVDKTNDTRYAVHGRVIYITSADMTGSGASAGEQDVIVTVDKQSDGSWKITQYSAGTFEESTASGTGTIAARIDQGASALGVKIVPLEVLEDSRCATDVQCIQAGTVRVRAQVQTNGATVEQTFTLEQPVELAGGMQAELTSVMPAPVSTQTIAPSEYRFTFTVSGSE